MEPLPKWKDTVYEAIHLERVRIYLKYTGLGNPLPVRSPDDPFWLPVLIEDVEEVAKSLRGKEDLEHLRKELIKVAALAADWIDAVDCEIERTGF
jgi:hypothetical protein